jgi:uncharacterized protein YbjT (DUF2867 family)
LVPALLGRDFDVRAMSRDASKLDDAPWRSDVEVVEADLSDHESMVRACDRVDVVYYLVHSMGTSANFPSQERVSAETLVAAARSAGVRRIVYLGGLHPDHCELSKHLESRTTVGNILLGSGLKTVVLQAGVIVGSGSASFEMIRHLTERLPVMTTPKWVHNTIQPISITDVLHYLVEAATAPLPGSRQWDIGGPDVLEYGEMMQVYAEAAGLRRRLIAAVPFLTPSLASWWVGWVTPIPLSLARPLVESLECDAVMGNRDIDAVIAAPPGGLTSYRDAVQLSLRRVTEGRADRDPRSAQRGEPWELLPTDPAWAGEVVDVMGRSALTSVPPEVLWRRVAEVPVPRSWRVRSRARSLRLENRARRAGRLWLEIRVSDAAGGSRYEQRMVFYPRGIAGQLYWLVTRPRRRWMFRHRFDGVVAKVS